MAAGAKGMPETPRIPWEGTCLSRPDSPGKAPDPPARANNLRPGQLEEHRAEIIITLAVISLFPIFGLIAFAVVAMAWLDLRKMAGGKMDPAGRTQTIVGLALGLIELFFIAAASLYFAIRAFY